MTDFYALTQATSTEHLWPTPPTQEQMVQMYRTMSRVRAFETEILKAGEAIAIHSSAGHEAVAVGTVAQLRPDDLVVGNHRAWHWAISKGVTLKEAFGELMGRQAGICYGMGGEMVISAPERGFVIASMIIGANMTLATGVALSLKHGKVTWDGQRFVNSGEPTDQVAVVFLGDATSTNGHFNGALTMAKTFKLPILFVCESNGINGNTPAKEYLPTELVAHRASGYGFPTNVCDGSDVFAVWEAAQKAIQYVREHRSPYFLECLVQRINRHKVPRMGDVRPSEVKRMARMRDPLPKLRNALLSEKILTQEQVDAIELDERAEVANAVDFAKASPLAVRP